VTIVEKEKFTADKAATAGVLPENAGIKEPKKLLGCLNQICKRLLLMCPEKTLK